MNSDFAARERESVIEGLASRDDELRRLAVERILYLPVPEAIPLLIKSLGDPSWRVRKAGVERLQACRQPELVADALISALWDGENPGRRNSAVEALTGMGASVVDRLIASLAVNDTDVRKLLVDTIGAIGDVGATTAMIRALADADPNVRASAADALGAIGDSAAEQSLRESAVNESEDRLVRLSSLRALASLEAVVCAGDLDAVLEDSVLASAGYTVLGNLDDEATAACLLKGLTAISRASREAAIEALLRVLSRRDDSEFDALAERIREVGRSNPELIQGCIEHLATADLSTRLVLIQFLGLVGEASCVAAILEAAKDEAIAEVALSTLLQMGEVSEAAIDLAWDSLDPAVRPSACKVLAGTFGDRATERLLEAMNAGDASERMIAAKALGAHCCELALVPFVARLVIAANCGGFEAEEECVVLVDALIDLCRPRDGAEAPVVERAIALLGGLLDDASDETCLAIAQVLGRIGRDVDAELVTSLMKDSDPRVRGAAVEALSRLSSDASIESLRLALADESYRVRIAALNALAKSSQGDVSADFERLIGDEDWRVRAATLRAIGQVEGVGLSQEEKIRFLQTGVVDDGAVCLAALETISRIGGDGAARVALSVLNRPDPELVQAAVGCLAAHGSNEDLLDLLPLVAHESWAVRAEVINALAARRVTRALPSILRRLESEPDAFVRDSILQGLKRLEA